jgi:hypothetical protein
LSDATPVSAQPATSSESKSPSTAISDVVLIVTHLVARLLFLPKITSGGFSGKYGIERRQKWLLKCVRIDR